VIVTNIIVPRDLPGGGAILPDARLPVIFDEGHHLPDKASPTLPIHTRIRPTPMLEQRDKEPSKTLRTSLPGDSALLEQVPQLARDPETASQQFMAQAPDDVSDLPAPKTSPARSPPHRLQGRR